MAVKCILTGQTPSVLDGVTENVQTQINNKVDKVTGKGLSTNDYTSAEKTKLSGIETGAQKNTITGVKGNAETTYRTGNVNITATNIGLGNVNNTSDAEKPISTATQTALNGKQATITGAATTITDNNLTANRALISNSNGKVEVSSVTSTELGYLDGVTSNIQTQLNNKLSSAPVTSVNNKTGAVTLAKGDVGLGNVDNTSDANKPISNATQAALNDKQDALTGMQGQVVGFDENGNAVAQNAPSGGGMTEEAADGKYLKLAGGDMSGKLTAPKIETGSGDTNYFQSRKFRGEGDAATYYHAIDFGYQNHDRVDFHEYGGIWNFFKNTSGKAGEGSLCGKITTNGWEGNAKLTGSPTAPTPGTSDNSTRIATTAFVNSFNSTKLERNGDGSNVTASFTAASSRTNISTGEKLSVIFGKIAKFFSDLKTVAFTGSYNDLSDKPTIPSTTSLIKGNGSGGVSAAVKGTDYAAPSVGVSVTLRASGWDADAKTQTVSVAGVTATTNCIITAAPDSYMAYAKAGVRCTAQGAGTLTFACETVPTANVAANVLIVG